MKILLTGAGGQLGRALQAALRDSAVVALAHEQLDVTRLDDVRQAVRAHAPALAVNAAAFNDVDGAESRQTEAYAVNAVGPRNLALATSAGGIPLLHVSTDYVFDGKADRPYDESDTPAPLSVYGASKLAGESAVRELNQRHYIVRTAWLYAAEGRNFANAIRARADRPPVRVVSDQYGSPTYAPHLADAIRRLIATDAYGTVHLAGRGAASWLELAQCLYAELGIATPLIPISATDLPRPAARPRYSVLSTIRQPPILLPPWQEGVRTYARFS